jgi:hypothetical protein
MATPSSEYRPATSVAFAPLLPLLDASGPSGLRVRQFARVVAAATSVHAGLTVHTPIRCRRRPLRRACEGHLLVRRQDVPALIQWGCPECRDHGALVAWRRTPQDLSDQPASLLPEVEVVLQEPEYRALEALPRLGAPAGRVVMGAAFTPFGIRLSGERAELDALLDALFAAARDPAVEIPQATLDRAAVTLDRGRRRA